MKPSYRERSRIFWNQVVPTVAGEFPIDPTPPQTKIANVTSVLLKPPCFVMTNITDSITATTTAVTISSVDETTIEVVDSNSLSLLTTSTVLSNFHRIVSCVH
jgi:hypothetical protein